MSITPRKNRRQKSSILDKARWAAYAAAGAATVFGAYESAEAEIIWSGDLDKRLDGSRDFVTRYSNEDIDLNNDLTPDLRMQHWGSTFSGNPYGVAVVNPKSFTGMARVAGFTVQGPKNLYSYALRFVSGDTIGRDLSFVARGTMAYSYSPTAAPNAQFGETGIGFVGFSFDGDKGTHYGWVKVDMDTPAPHNAYRVLGWAYNDVADESIKAGQTTMVPEPGSLGLLATGGIGLLLWRQKRRRSNQTKV